jgi:hypothetical protein
MMNLDEAQRRKVAAWIADGLKLSDIQNRLLADFGLKMTYMEVRLLVDDLKLVPKDPEPPRPATPIGQSLASGAAPAAAAKPAGTPPAAGPVSQPAETPRGTGAVSVTVDQLARPGAIVSGKVTFSDGNAADWYLDQTGRLGVVTKQQGYKPPASDMQQFQMALETQLAKLGF